MIDKEEVLVATNLVFNTWNHIGPTFKPFEQLAHFWEYPFQRESDWNFQMVEVKKGNLEGRGVNDFGIQRVWEGGGGKEHFGISESKGGGGLKCSCYPWIFSGITHSSPHVKPIPQGFQIFWGLQRGRQMPRPPDSHKMLNAYPWDQNMGKSEAHEA